MSNDLRKSIIPKSLRKGKILIVTPFVVIVAIVCIFFSSAIPVYVPLATFALQILFLTLDYRSTKAFLALGFEERNKIFVTLMKKTRTLEEAVIIFYVFIELFPMLVGLMVLPVLGMTLTAVATLFTSVPAISHAFAYSYNKTHVRSSQ
jgi:hypothetical protein